MIYIGLDTFYNPNAFQMLYPGDTDDLDLCLAEQPSGTPSVLYTRVS